MLWLIMLGYIFIGGLFVLIRCETIHSFDFFAEGDNEVESAKNMLLALFWPTLVLFYIIKGLWWFISHLVLSFKLVIEDISYRNSWK